MTDSVWIFICATVLAVAALLAAEHRGSRVGIWIAKPAASIGFIATALAAGALATPYGTTILIALILCLAGDVLLIPEDAPAVFKGGVLAFLLGHVVYAVAFALRGLDPTASLATAMVAVVPVGLVLRWLQPHLPDDMRIAVYAYIVVISTMLVCAVGATVAGAPTGLLVGASMFYVSDLAVARDRFVAPGFANRTWGLPLYFGGQLVLATTVAG